MLPALLVTALLMMKTKSRQGKTRGEKPLLGLMLQHQGTAQEGISQLIHKGSQTARLCGQKGGVARVSPPIMADLQANEGLYLHHHRPSTGLIGKWSPSGLGKNDHDVKKCGVSICWYSAFRSQSCSLGCPLASLRCPWGVHSSPC
jgi:hypothetical protein